MQPQELRILYEDKQLLAINKPHGIVVEAEPHLKYTLESLALSYLKQKDHYPWKCFIGVPHRLDRPVSGVVLFSKKRSALKMLVDIFAKREIEKAYWAITGKRPAKDEGELINWLVKNTEKRRALIHDKEVPDSMKVILRYKVLSEKPEGTQLEIKLITGKFHQIRAQLSYIGCPIVGDSFYGSSVPYKENAICLHARQLKFVHPVTNQPLTLIAEPPADEIWNNTLERGLL